MNWYVMRGPGGTITRSGNCAAEAIAKASEVWNCGTDEIEVEERKPFSILEEE